MQLMPETAKQFGASNPDDPQQSIRAGVNYLKYLDRYWSKTVNDQHERLKFVLASYNAGLSHIVDGARVNRQTQRKPNGMERCRVLSAAKIQSRVLPRSSGDGRIL
jgi:membrane-bound lytic murein transglycosylase F